MMNLLPELKISRPLAQGVLVLGQHGEANATWLNLSLFTKWELRICMICKQMALLVKVEESMIKGVAQMKFV